MAGLIMSMDPATAHTGKNPLKNQQKNLKFFPNQMAQFLRRRTVGRLCNTISHLIKVHKDLDLGHTHTGVIVLKNMKVLPGLNQTVFLYSLGH